MIFLSFLFFLFFTWDFQTYTLSQMLPKKFSPIKKYYIEKLSSHCNLGNGIKVPGETDFLN